MLDNKRDNRYSINHSKNYKQTLIYDPEEKCYYRKGIKLGGGGFGEVYQIINDSTGEIRAAKIIPLKSIEKDKQSVASYSNEKKLNRYLDYKYLCKCYSIFQDKNNAYFILDYQPNSTLNELMNNRETLSEIEVKHYGYELLLAMEYLHNRDIIHRDIKLGNVLLSEKMEVKLCDFGLAIENNNEFNHTLCGTPNYMAPEIFAHKNGCNYSVKIDIWSFGIILYALFYKNTPFEESGKDKTKNNIINLKYNFPSKKKTEITREAKDLIKKILVSDPKRRPNIQEIKSSPFFQNGKGIPKFLPPSTLKNPLSDEKLQEFVNLAIENNECLDTEIVEPKNNNNKRVYKFNSCYYSQECGNSDDSDLESEKTDSYEEELRKENEALENKENQLKKCLKNTEIKDKNNISNVSNISNNSNNINIYQNQNNDFNKISNVNNASFSNLNLCKSNFNKKKSNEHVITFNLSNIKTETKNSTNTVTNSNNTLGNSLFKNNNDTFYENSQKIQDTNKISDVESKPNNNDETGAFDFSNNSIRHSEKSAKSQSTKNIHRRNYQLNVNENYNLNNEKMINLKQKFLSKNMIIIRNDKKDIRVLKFIDLSRKCGLGYILSNGDVGAIFNDNTKMIKIKNSSNIIYIDSDEKPFKIDLNYDLKSDIENKGKLLLMFNKLFFRNNRKLFNNNNENNENEIEAYVVKWTSTSKALFFLFSNNEIQVFFIDMTQVIFNIKTKIVTYIDHFKKHFKEDMRLNNFPTYEMTVRVLYAKQILSTK